MPLSLRHLLPPYFLFGQCRIRTPRPLAMTSMFRIGPRISTSGANPCLLPRSRHPPRHQPQPDEHDQRRSEDSDERTRGRLTDRIHHCRRARIGACPTRAWVGQPEEHDPEQTRKDQAESGSSSISRHTWHGLSAPVRTARAWVENPCHVVTLPASNRLSRRCSRRSSARRLRWFRCNRNT